MKRKLVLGSRNLGKIQEFRYLLRDEPLDLFSWRDYDQAFEVKEDGRTFLENALKKAEATARLTGEVALADDSGLEVDFLHGAPGVYSARYAGPDARDEENNAKLFRELSGIPESLRGARFVAVLVIFTPDGKWDSVEGECRGVISESLQGNQGFGYDPLFFLPEWKKTFAQLSPEEKNRISHRAKALKKIRPLLKKYFSGA